MLYIQIVQYPTVGPSSFSTRSHSPFVFVKFFYGTEIKQGAPEPKSSAKAQSTKHHTPPPTSTQSARQATAHTHTTTIMITSLVLCIFLPFLVESYSQDCSQYKTCASCLTVHHTSATKKERHLFGTQPHCQWDRRNHYCQNHDTYSKSNKNTIIYESDCPLAPHEYPKEPPSLLPHWMGTLFFSKNLTTSTNITLSELSLPGTHDSLSYDLSLVISKHDIENHPAWWWMHSFSKHLPKNAMEEFIRRQAKTQQLTLAQQLDNGVRFIDFRLTYSDRYNWYGTHFLQTKHTVPVYWRQLRNWLDQHPTELVVIWLSQHGNTQTTGTDQFPDTPIYEKQWLWNTTFVPMFQDLLLDTRNAGEDIFHTTSIQALIQEYNYRLIPIVSDWKEFTASSPHALNAADVLENHYHNEPGDLLQDGPESFVRAQLQYFQHLQHQQQQHQQQQDKQTKMTLLGMNTQSPPWLIKALAKRRFVPFSSKSSSCTLWKNTNTTIKPSSWCPGSLLDLAQLSNYYNQYSIEEAFSTTKLPMAWYLDALDYNGTIRTGCQVLDGYDQDSLKCQASSYALVDTILLYNAKQICRHSGDNSTCGIYMKTLLEERRNAHPFQFWSDPSHGRLVLDKT